MASRIPFADAPSAADAVTFARRAARFGEGGVRLRAEAGVLALSTAILAPRGLLDETPTILAMRFAGVDPELVCDVIVDGDTLRQTSDGRGLALPDTALSASWAGISPPRTGWEDAGAVAAAALAARAQWGMSAVAHALPDDAGEEIVRTVRGEVWGAADDELDGLPRGVAFAAFGLGFIAGDERAAVRRSGAWTRVSLPRGHVLIRGANPPGLTPVRRTGPAAA